MNACGIILCAIIAVTISVNVDANIFQNLEPAKNCVEVSSLEFSVHPFALMISVLWQDLIKKTGEEHPDLKNWIDTHRNDVLELLDKFLECRKTGGIGTALVLQKMCDE